MQVADLDSRPQLSPQIFRGLFREVSPQNARNIQFFFCFRNYGNLPPAYWKDGSMKILEV